MKKLFHVQWRNTSHGNRSRWKRVRPKYPPALPVREFTKQEAEAYVKSHRGSTVLEYRIVPIPVGKPRIHQNVWGNWYGYIGRKRVIAFGNSKEETAEQAANRWLKEQSK
jgi:hypothetical protein